MKSRQLHEVNGLRTFAVVMDKGDDAVEELARFARENGVTGASLASLGRAGRRRSPGSIRRN